MGLMDDVRAQVQKLDENQIREQLAKIKERQAVQQAKQKERIASMTPEEKAVRRAKQEEYRKKNPEKWKARRDAYNKKPEVVARRKAYMKQRNEFNKALRARAKELGITA